MVKKLPGTFEELQNRLKELHTAGKKLRQQNQEWITAERKQAELELKQRAAQLALINDIGSKIAAALELDSVLDRTACLVQETFDYHHVALFLVDEGVLKLKAVAGSYKTYFPPDHTQQLSEGINGWVASQGKKIVANNVNIEPRYISLIPEHTITSTTGCRTCSSVVFVSGS